MASRAVASLVLAWVPTSASAEGIITNCTETHLRAALAGGGLVTFSCDGTIALTYTISITTNTALDAGARQVVLDGQGAVRLFEVASGASLTLTNLTLTRGFSTNGGAIYNEGTLVAARCTIRSNSAVGVDGVWYQYFGSSGDGGGIFNSGTAEFRECVFLGNSAKGGRGTATFKGFHLDGYPGRGGAVYSGNDLVVSRCTFSRSITIGGGGISDPLFPGTGGSAAGGAIYNSQRAEICGTTFAGNEVRGGDGSDSNSHGSGRGGHGGGGAVCNAGSLAVTNATFDSNTARGGSYGRGSFGPYSSGSGLGGGVCSESGVAVISSSTLAGNASIGGSGGLGLGGGIYTMTGAVLEAHNTHNTIIAFSTNGGDASGQLTDLGHNLCSDGSCNLTNRGSLNATDPRLGPLTNNGGPTLTMALHSASPAIEAGDPDHSPSLDQRGVPRPQLGISDIGATEFDLPWPRVVRLASASYRVIEGQPMIQIGLTCTGNPEGTVTVRCATLNGTAIAPGDYSSVNQEVTFAAGERSNTVSIPILEDNVLEENETFQVVLSHVAGPAYLDTPSNVVVTIVEKMTPTGVCSGSELAAAVEAGGEITFGCNGTIILTKALVITNETILDGRLRSLTLSGNNNIRLFEVQAGGRLTLRNLVLAHGRYSGLLNSGGWVEIDRCRFLSNSVQGNRASWIFGRPYLSYPASPGLGGAIHNKQGTVSIRRTTFAWNRSYGGNGTLSLDGLPYWAGSNGLGGAIFNGDFMTIEESTLMGNQAIGGEDVHYTRYSGNGIGGAICNSGRLQLTNCTFSANASLGGIGSGATSGNLWQAGLGGALCNFSGTTLAGNVTMAANQAAGFNGGVSLGGNIYVATGDVLLANSNLASSVGASNCFGGVIDSGHNISSDGSCAFDDPGSLNSADPRLGPLTSNGGPTLTMALLTGSPAINAGEAENCPPTDQRGVSRPQGPRCDVGAFESSLLSIAVLAEGRFRLTYDTTPGRTCLLQVSDDFVSWTDAESVLAGPEGVAIFEAERSPTRLLFRVLVK